MKLEMDTLQYVKKLCRQGVDSKIADAFVEGLSATELFNVYSKEEINSMVPDTVQKMLDEANRKFEEREERLERQSERRIAASEKRFEAEILELRSHRRWIVSTVIGVGAAILAYLHFMH